MPGCDELRRRLVCGVRYKISIEISINILQFDRKERLGECNKETAFKILDTYYENEGNFIDT
jgi:hypothetical protein